MNTLDKLSELIPNIDTSAFAPSVDRVKNWSELTPEQRREERFKRWLSPNVQFNSPEAEKLYKERTTRFIKAIKLEEPDRVPVLLPSGFFPAYYAGMNLQTVMYDYDKLKEAYMKFINEFEMDSYTSPALVLPAKVLEMTDHRLHRWPGYGLPDNTSIYQFVEQEYMKADEYDAFLENPTEFWLRVFLPRIVGAFEPFRKLPPFSGMMGLPIGYYVAVSSPDVQAAFQIFIDAGKEIAKWLAAVAEVSRASLAAGIPNVRGGGMSGAPFDMIADMLRGTRGAVMDMYRQPDKLFEAMEKLTTIAIRSAVARADASGCPVVFMPLHKGNETFMSPKQFETFYWPFFRKLLMGMIDEGLVPYPFAEGRYGARLEVIKDLPRSSMIWSFEDIDMARAKKVLGDSACIAGNVPVSLMHAGTPRDVKEYCRRLIETCAPGGGYILTGAAGMNEGNPDILRAMMAAAKEYGVYNK
jgi:uroporphyrinogen-III decarboxylase